MKNHTSLLLLSLILAGCRTPVSSQELHRCHDRIDLGALIKQLEVPPQTQGWGSLSAAESLRGALFDMEQEATLRLPEPAGFMRVLCTQLQQQLESQCEVRSFAADSLYCMASTRSRLEETTNARGRYLRRPSAGRVSLFAHPSDEQKTRIVLAATEWEN